MLTVGTERDRLVPIGRVTHRAVRLQSPQHPGRTLILHTHRERHAGQRQRDLLHMYLLVQKGRSEPCRSPRIRGPVGEVRVRIEGQETGRLQRGSWNGRAFLLGATAERAPERQIPWTEDDESGHEALQRAEAGIG